MKIKDFDTICAPLTVRGESAISVIRISGPESFKITQNILKNTKDINSISSHKVKLDYIQHKTEIIDKILFTVFKAPNSFTGENSIEISTHGSPIIVDKVIELLIKNDARMARKGEFTKRAFIHGKMTLTEAESIIDVIESKTDKVLSYATQNLMGKLDKKLNKYTDKLMGILSLLNLSIDFDEEFIEETNWDGIKEKIKNIKKSISNDIKTSKRMLKEKRGIVVLLLGPPNVGKSTLMNTILEKERAIVSEIAGTTRDYISEELILQGHHVRLYDTAGLREDADKLEKLGINKTKELINMSEIVIFLEELDKDYEEGIKEKIKSKNVEMIEVINKIDLFDNKNFSNKLTISAKDKINIDKLVNKLLEKIEKITGVNKTDSVIINQRQLDYFIRVDNILSEALKIIDKMSYEEIVSERIQDAVETLEKINGKKITDTMLNSIFNRFCIGK